MPKEILIKPKQTRKRIPRTCAQCRKRKQKCDSLKPCAVCSLRGEGDLCDYSGAQPTRVLDDEDKAVNQISAEELRVLRQQVDDLEHAISAVITRPTAGSSALFGGDPNNSLAIDMDEFNLASVLSNILNCRAGTTEFNQESPIIQKVRRQARLDENLPPTPTTGIYSTRGLFTYFNKQLNSGQHSDLHNQLPTYEQSTVFLATYLKEFEWYHSCFNANSYTTTLSNLYAPNIDFEKDHQSRCVSMAICFAIARSTIVKLSAQQCMDLKLPIEPSGRITQSKFWLDMSVACLKGADFELNPMLESVSCLIILLEIAQFDVIAGGMEDLSMLYDLKCKAMQLGFDLCLHRDPSHRNSSNRDSSHLDPSGTVYVDPAAARERRMIWWALLSIDGLYSDLTGRMSSIVGLEAVDVFLPALSTTAHPEEVHEGCEQGCKTSTPAAGTKPRQLIGYVGHEISRLPLQRTPLPTINDVHQAHRDLVSLEVHLPEGYKLHTIDGHLTDQNRLPRCSKARRDAIYFYMRYHYLFVKLHRPLHFINKRESDKMTGLEAQNTYHRSAVVDHSLLLLDLLRISGFSNNYIYGNSMALEASFSLALDYLYDSKSKVSNLIKEELKKYLNFLQNSQIWLVKRGVNILQCLMATWGSPPPNGSISWLSTVKAPLSPGSWIQGPFHQPSESNVPPADREDQPEKANRSTCQTEQPAYMRVFQPLYLPESSPLMNPSSWPAGAAQAINSRSTQPVHAGNSLISNNERSQMLLSDYNPSGSDPNPSNSFSQFDPSSITFPNEGMAPSSVPHDPYNQFQSTQSHLGYEEGDIGGENPRRNGNNSKANHQEDPLNIAELLSNVVPGQGPAGLIRFENQNHSQNPGHPTQQQYPQQQPQQQQGHPFSHHHLLTSPAQLNHSRHQEW